MSVPEIPRVPAEALAIWANNETHLSYLEQFIGSIDRDRDFPSPPGARGMAYKLPRWMQIAAHREELLAEISKLRRGRSHTASANQSR